MQVVLLSAEYLPAAQSTQLAATALEYVPAAQSVQASAPALGAYLPDTQPAQSPFVPDQPAWHKQYAMLALRDTEKEFSGHQMHSVLLSAEYLPAAQSTQLAATALEYVPAAQSMQAAVPSLGVYFPETQLLQSVFVPDQPARHKQYDMLALRDTEYEFAGHQMQSVLLSAENFPATQSLHVFVAAFTENEYFPGRQSVHASDPLLALYLPDTQPLQSPFAPDQPALHKQ